MKHTLILILLLISVPCAAQWKYEGTNGQVLAFGIHDGSLFFSYEGHLYGPNGRADTGINFSDGNITSFVSLGKYFFGNENTTYAATFETSNNGSSWYDSKAQSVGSNGYYLFGVAIHPFSPKPPYVALSRDSGQDWDSVSIFNNGSYTTYFAANGTCIYSATGGTTVTSLWRSLDTGTIGSWKQLPEPPFVGTMLTMGSVLFMYQNYRSGTAGANNGVLIVSKDSGMTWDTVRVDSAGVPEYVTSLATDGKNLFAGGVSSISVQGVYYGNGVYVSTDTGQHWRAVNDGLTTNMNIEAMCVYDTFLYISTNCHNYPGDQTFCYATYYRPIREITDTTQNMAVQTSQPGDTIEVYPNPATGTVTIFSGGTSILGVGVLNVLGEAVLTTPNPLLFRFAP